MKRRKHLFIKDKANKGVAQCSHCLIWKITDAKGEISYRRPDGFTDNTPSAKNCFKLSN